MSKTEFIEILRKNYNRMLLTKKETAHELNISTATIDRLRKSGELNSKKVSGMILFSLDEIARFVYET
ncbi:helix-turn-helix domain-containing protein [Malaciobacter mytili]|uniref:helix-turn-helix domain-containing protein n=1 Tax=Malaciobacter mytili TaxID=603050 RepID=UPI003BAF8342